MKRILYILILLYLPGLAYTQVINKLDYSRDSIGIGEQTAFIYEISIPTSISIKSIDFSSLDSLESQLDLRDSLIQDYYAEVEWSDKFNQFQNKIIPASRLHFTSNGPNKIYRDTFVATFWDYGIYKPQNPIINYKSDSISIEEINVQNKALIVSPPSNIVNPDTTQLILPIEDILEEAVSWKDFLNYIYILLGILLIVSILYFLYRKSQKITDTDIEPLKAEPQIPPQVMALTKLESLANEQLWMQGKVKEHQSRLSHIIREYLENLFGIKALESTTDEILIALKDFNFQSAQQQELKDILQIADLVKFAKANPPENINEIFIGKAERFVVETHKIYSDFIISKLDEDE